MNTTQRIGFGKKIRLDWLALGLRLRASGSDFEAARERLSFAIGETNAGKVAITKALSNVRQVVFLPAKDNEAFADFAIGFLREHGDQHALEIAWGLSLVSYSFFASTMETAGRLLRLNEAFTAAELLRRLSEKEGDRGFVNRVGRYNLSSVLDWGVLELTSGTKQYRRARPKKVRSTRLAAWLLEAALRVSGKSTLPIHQLSANPALFPFELPIIAATQLTTLNPRLTTMRLGLNEELVAMRELASQR